jgi:hypothetical protein
MLSSSPAFPPIEQWQAMSEAEQDALIGRIETTRRRKRGLLRLFLGITCTLAVATICTALYLQFGY